MADKSNLKQWVYEAVLANGGRSSIVEVAMYIWDNHEQELRQSGNLFYTWQYDMRWAATMLRRDGKFGEGWEVK